MNLKGKNFLKLLDFTPEEIGGLLELAAELKAQKKAEAEKIYQEWKDGDATEESFAALADKYSADSPEGIGRAHV